MWLGAPKARSIHPVTLCRGGFPSHVHTLCEAAVAERGLNLNVKDLSTPRRELVSKRLHALPRARGQRLMTQIFVMLLEGGPA